MLEIVIAPQGNKREVPPDHPYGAWLDDLRYLAELPNRDELISNMDWYHPVMEYLEPALLIRLRIQAIVWKFHTGAYPDEVAHWWPVRLGRRPHCLSCNYRSDNNTEWCDRCGQATEPAQVPHMTDMVEANIDSSGVLHCGFCGARWSANHDGSPHEGRCQLCDRLWLVVNDEREVKEYDPVIG